LQNRVEYVKRLKRDVKIKRFRPISVLWQAFYTKFYIPEKDLYPQEVECTDKLSRALVVRSCLILLSRGFMLK